MSYQPIYAEAGEYLGLRTSMRDITRRKEAEEALAKSESRLKMAMNSVNEAVWDWHLDKDDTYFSDRWYTMLGYTPENLPGGFDVWVSLVHPDDLAAVKKTIAGHLKSGAPFEIEFRVKASDGQWRWILGRGKTVGRNEKGRAERMLGTYTDITERKRVEEQLLQAQKIEAVGTLAGGIAHDFNNILGAIIGYTQLARMFYDDDKDKCFDSLDKVLTASYRARDLVNHILAFSRKSEVKDVPVYVPGMVKETLKMLRASLPATIVIRHEVDIPKGTVRIDPAQMHQVLMNLCTNAAHAMEENGGELSVCLNVMEKEAVDWPGTRIPTEDRYLAIQVSDTGHGIPAKVLPQIFEPYFTTKEKGQGTGLGLSIVYGIVKRYGGEVSVQSRPGFTVFTLYLPFDTKAPEGHSRDTGTVVTGEGRLLFVDDEAPLLEVARRLLSRLGYEIDTESNSKAAFERFKKQPHVYDLLITDQTMPGMTGLELAGKVRDIRPDLPILLCTGYSDKVNEDVLIKNNISAFVHKPLNAENLSHLVAGLLNPEGVAAGSDIN